MNTCTAIADAIVAALEAGTFSMTFAPMRVHLPDYTLDELASLRVTVSPRSVTPAGAARQTDWWDCAFDIAIQKRVADDDEVDELLDLAEEILDSLRSTTRLEAAPWAGLLTFTHDPMTSLEHLDQHRTLTSLITVTYRALRDKAQGAGSASGGSGSEVSASSSGGGTEI